MILNYLIVAMRALGRSKGVTALKIASLSLGFVCALPVLMHLRQAVGIDGHFPGVENIYRLSLDFDIGDRHVSAMTTSAAYEPPLREAFPEIRRSANVRGYYGMFTIDGLSHFGEFAIVDPEFADIFSLEFVAGDPLSALAEPSGIVLTESEAQRLFPDADPLGRILTFDEMADFNVTGVVRDLPTNTHFDLSMLVSVRSMQQVLGAYFMSDDAWGQFVGTVTYLAFDDATAAQRVAAGLPNFVAESLPLMQDADPDMRNVALSLEPLREVYLSERQVWGGQNPRTQVFGYSGQPRAQVLAGLGIFALLILATACANFTSLTLAQLQRRQQETGVRRTLGAGGGDVAIQCLVETGVVTLCAMVVALPCVYVALPAYTAMTGIDFAFRDVANSGLLLQLGALALVTTLASGLLPAFALSRSNPAETATRKGTAARRQRFVLKLVSSLQFGIALTLIMFALAVQLQVNYLGQSEVGFDKRDLVLFDSTFNWERQDLFDHGSLTAELAAHPGVLAVGGTNLPLPLVAASTSNLRIADSAPDDYVVVPSMVVDGGFIEALQVPLLAGRNFPAVPDPSARARELLITRATATRLGFATPPDAVGELLLTDMGGVAGRVIGVVDDIRSAGGMENPATSPGVFETYGPPKTYFLLRLDPTLRDAALRHIETVWERYRLGIPLNLRFYERIYEDVVAERTRSISNAATFASIITTLISIFGIQALALYSSERRTREVGIRKVLGATSLSIVLLIAWDLLKPVLVASLFAWDSSGYVIERYLNQFTSRTEVSPLVYLVLTLALLLLVGLSTGLQIYRTAGKNPVLALRYE